MSEEVRCSPDRPCTAVQLLTQKVNDHEERMDKMDRLLETIRNRPPIWMTFSLTASGSVIGLLVGLLTKH